MYLSREIRLRSKFLARSLVLMNFISCGLYALTAFLIPSMGSVIAALIQPDLDILIQSADIFPIYGFVLMSLGISVVLFIIDAPLVIGFFSWLSELTMGRKQPFSYLFSWCTTKERFFKSFAISGAFVLRGLFEALKACTFPVLVILYLYMRPSGIPEQVYMMVSAFASIFLLVMVVIAAVGIFSNIPAMYLLAAAPQMSVKEGFAQCRDFMYDKRGEAFKLLASFIPWFLLKRFSYGLTGLFSVPYFYLAVLMFVQQIYNRWLFETGKVDRYVDPLSALLEGGGADV